MGLSPEQLKAREGKITASRIGALMSGDDAKVMDLWRELVGAPGYQPPDLSRVWPVQLGSVTEELNLDWYEVRTGRPLTRRGEVVVMKDVPWAAATLDGYDAALRRPVECKHVGGREPLWRIIQRYTPQCTWQMLVVDCSECALSVIEGANEPVIEVLKLDYNYAREIMRRAGEFIRCVETLTPPVALEAVTAPTQAVKVYDFTSSNQWADYAATWLENRIAAGKAVTAEKGLKAFMPMDAQRAHGHGVEILRDRASRLHLKAA